jgi:inorganic phosphate transporter, PiT family
MDAKLVMVSVIVLIALAFDFINGFHDAANSIATVVSTRVLGPRTAVAMAAFFNFFAFLVFPLHVAGTIGKGIVDPGVMDMAVITGALVGAIIWNLLTWWWALPSSSSHALVGGLIGAGVAKGGFGVLGMAKIVQTAIFIVVSPLVGMLVSGLMTIAFAWILRNRTPGKVDQWFRRLQLVSASVLSLSHGGNDAQKTMGIITALLFAHGQLSGEFHVPLWVVVACNGAIALGTFLGGWRIVRTMGSRITRLTPMQGVCAETAGSITLFMATGLGIPVSTTHTITGAIVGVGAARRTSAVRWSVAQEIVIAWVVTMPAAAMLGAAFYGLANIVLR